MAAREVKQLGYAIFPSARARLAALKTSAAELLSQISRRGVAGPRARYGVRSRGARISEHPWETGRTGPRARASAGRIMSRQGIPRTKKRPADDAGLGTTGV